MTPLFAFTLRIEGGSRFYYFQIHQFSSVYSKSSVSHSCSIDMETNIDSSYEFGALYVDGAFGNMMDIPFRACMEYTSFENNDRIIIYCC